MGPVARIAESRAPGMLPAEIERLGDEDFEEMLRDLPGSLEDQRRSRAVRGGASGRDPASPLNASMNSTALDLPLAGLGVIVYSPFALTDVSEGDDFLSRSFTKPEDVARHVSSGRIAAFCTGSPGDFRLHLRSGEPPGATVGEAAFAVRLCLEVRDGCLCVRDLFDLMDWDGTCPTGQTVPIADGFYRITALSSPPPSGVLGDGQAVHLWFARTPELPEIVHVGVPMLCPTS